jgi:hypothetical protein
MEWLNFLKETIVYLYYISGIILVTTVIIGLYQLQVLKDDIRTKNKRASVEKSIEYLSWFAKEFIPQRTSFNEKITDDGVILYNNKHVFNKKFTLDESQFTSEMKKEVIIRAEHDSEDLLNQLEFFSAAMLSGLADEELAFNPLATIFCEFIEDQFLLICYIRGDQNLQLYSNMITLYNMWKNRLERKKIEMQHKDLEEKLSKIEDKSVKSIGV